ncbi:MAG TPA: hypothetical protein VLW06_16860 [Terriglobales bacterium]|nr:hypothetical protein [Terriglobales bacterium]
MASPGSKVPIERRRRNRAGDDLLRMSPDSVNVPLRRKSDQVKAQLRRWIDLGDKALGQSQSEEDLSDPAA